MPTIFAASESKVLIDGEAIEGVRALDYRFQQDRTNVYAMGSTERIGMVSGPQFVEGRLKVASTHGKLNTLTGDKPFQISSLLNHGQTKMTVTFDDCYLTDKHFEMSVGGVGEMIYSFTATRVREELA